MNWQVSSLYFSIFRFFFGVLMIPQVFSLIPHVHDLSKSTFVFHYPYLSFIEAYSHGLIDLLAASAIFGAILLVLGLIPRIGAFLFLISFGYLFLIDMSFYNNHYYLWCLIAFLFVVSDVHKSISIIDIFKKKKLTEIPIHIHNYMIFGLLISIVYFFGGVAKVNSDWLQGYPMRLMTASRGYSYPDFTGYLLSYVGLFFDLLIPFFLWIKPKSWYVVVPYMIFNLSNYFIFNIGEFPLVMIVAWIIYIPLSQLKKAAVKELFKSLFFNKSINSTILTSFFIFQMLFPLRSWLVGNNVAWHRQGYYFSWRMMLNNHEVTYFQFLVEMPEINDKYFVDFEKLLTYRQFYHAYHEPYMIWQLAQKLKSDAQYKYKTKKVYIYCKSEIMLNQHPIKPLINSEVDLGNEQFNLYLKNNFINY